LFEAYEDVYKRSTHFIYGYIVVTLAMWKWFPLEGWELSLIEEDLPLALRYTPWQTSGEPRRKEINEASFIGWYKNMMELIKATKRVPKMLLDDY